MDKVINIAYVAAEAVPFVKVGGLADVAGSLPKSINSLNRYSDEINLDLRVVLPLYKCGNKSNLKMEPIISFQLRDDFIGEEITAFKSTMNNTITYFLGGSYISDINGVYSDDPATDQEKFIIFSLAAVKLFLLLNWKVDILHANDWHTALCLYYLRSPVYSEFYSDTSGILTIHNLPYMGGHCGPILEKFNISIENDPDMPDWALDQPLAMGMVASDAIVTVSKTYAEEIQTFEQGCGLHNYLKSHNKKIRGIINGLNTEYWNPEIDPYIQNKFNINTLKFRLDNKEELQNLLQLKVEQNIPMIGMVTRINHQKGINLALNALDSLWEKDWQLVILGTGDPELETEVEKFKIKFPDKVRFINTYDESLAHKIYAGTDIFLMPSRYEPCGLSQMIANRYGCIPVVTNVGGLKDTIVDQENGFVAVEVEAKNIRRVLEKVLILVNDLDRWRRYQKNGMSKDYSWKVSAKEYVDLYQQLNIGRLEK